MGKTCAFNQQTDISGIKKGHTKVFFYFNFPFPPSSGEMFVSY